MRLRNITNLGKVNLPLLALVVATAALLVATGQAQAQNTCRPVEHLGTLGSNQTVLRVGTLTSSACYHTFDLAGQGRVTVTVSSDAFNEIAGIGTAAGAIFARANNNSYSPETITRVLPPGKHSAIAGSWDGRGRGGYELKITTGELEPAGPGQPQSPVGSGAATDADSPTTVRGYVIARVHPLPENDRRGAYRIEFGFLSAEVLASGTDRTAVVQANAHLLPPSRYLNEAVMLERARANNRRWLRSSPIDVFPFEGDAATLSGEPLLTGRVIARWNPTSGGRFRVEFGFLPEWAFEAAGADTQRAVELHANLLPNPGRYLSESRINSEANRNTPRWLASSLVTIGGPVANDRCTGSIAITPITTPLTLSRGETINDESIAMISGELGETFTPVTVAGLPPGLEWDLAETRSSGCEHQLTVSGTISASAAARNYTVQITAEGVSGSDSDTYQGITVTGEASPEITISCSPSSIEEGESARCAVESNSGGLISTYSWSAAGGSPSSDSSRTYQPRFNTAGTYTVSLTASNAGGSDDASTTVIVEQEPVERPRISIICSPSSIDEGESVTCEVSRNRGGEIDDYSWSASGGSPSRNSAPTYSPSFSREGRYTVSLTASNDGGDNTDTYRITVIGTDEPPSGDINCRPPATEVGSAIRCEWNRTGGDPATSWEWSGGDSRGSDPTYRPSFSSFGWQTVSLTVSNSGGRNSYVARIRVADTPPPSLYGRCGSDGIRVYWFDRSSYQKRHIDITGEQATAIFGRAWWDTIGHMSQSACDSWPTGPALTGRPPSR